VHQSQRFKVLILVACHLASHHHDAGSASSASIVSTPAARPRPNPVGASMCGIHAAISRSAHRVASPTLERRLRSRGPDHCGTIRTFLDGEGDGPEGRALYLTFTSTVLALRGDHVARQPLVDESSGSVLCWNGEAWKFRGRSVQGNDGEAILTELVAASRRRIENEGGDDVLDALRDIQGPFAFIFFDKPARRIYYGRDRLGRRSLLIEKGDAFSLSSVAESSKQGWAEVEADGCYTLDLNASSDAEMTPHRHDWVADDQLVSSGWEHTFHAANMLLRSQVLACSTSP